VSAARRAKGRDVDGVLILDKPVGMTSNAALQRVKNLYRARKAGHTGSLDRMASGMLPLCFGEATKLSSFLLDADKHYEAVCRLGVETTTGDAAGEVVATRPVPALTRERLEEVLDEFRGEIRQVPPMYSALKHKGQRLYELAYQGIEVEREPRAITIHTLELLSLEAAGFAIRVVCSKGTYIRTLAQDIGARLGCGAHVTALRRTGSGPFREAEMQPLEKLEGLSPAERDALLLPPDAVLRNAPEVHLTEPVAWYVRQGQPVIVAHAPTHGVVRIYDEERRFLGAGEVLDDGRVAPRRLLRTR
jgi:tRNA pseudouridine55 synthase